MVHGRGVAAEAAVVGLRFLAESEASGVVACSKIRVIGKICGATAEYGMEFLHTHRAFGTSGECACIITTYLKRIDCSARLALIRTVPETSIR